MAWSHLLLAAVPLAWLVPNHFFPWLSAWQDGLALLLLFAAAACTPRAAPLPRAWLFAATLVAASVAAQWTTGRIIFGGDALMVLVYGTAFVLSLALGPTLVVDSARPAPALQAWATGAVFCAVLSVGVALAQWTGAISLGLLGTDLPPGARPYANVSQANHFSTLCYWGLCCLLVLFELKRTGRWVTLGCAVFLLAGMTMSASRTGWLQIVALVVLAVAFRSRMALRFPALGALGLGVIYIALTVLWPWVNDLLLLSGGRAVTEQIQGGVRLPLWSTLLDALGREPWWGYGWQQVGLAQQTVASDHPPVRHYFQHSHNLVLDLLLWAGIPIGGLIVFAGGCAFLNTVRSIRDPWGPWLLAAVIGTLAHSMLEFPLEYAYFLIPTGLAIGALTGLSSVHGASRLSLRSVRVAGLAGVLLTSVIAYEYLQAENSYRILRLESARIGTSRIESKAPDLVLLTQLKAFANFARTEAREGLTADELERMKDVARRYGYASVLFRYAAAAGLNGLPAEATRALSALCSVHSRENCDESRLAWAALRERYPALRTIPHP